MTHTTSRYRHRPWARTRLVPGETDILSSLTAGSFAWWHRGEGLVTDGVAGRVPVRMVADILSAVDTDGDGPPGTEPVAVGALPFDPADAGQATMVIPARVWRSDAEGHTWLTQIALGDGTERSLHQGDSLVPPQAPSADTSYAEWAGAVRTAISSIEAGTIDKVVLARQVTVDTGAALSMADVVARLRAGQPDCYVFAADGLVGASPELLVERQGALVRSRPMAGTVPLKEEGALTRLEDSPKNLREHGLVVEAAVRCLEQLGSPRVVASSPRAQPFADLAHIVTDVEASLPPGAPSALDIALALHPTPAVAGTPTDAALALIADLERRPRGRYGGPVGWVDANGDGQFAVALRCAEVGDSGAVLYAGAGIVAGSTSEEEWEETEAKLEAMRRALPSR